jgi:hypothetical protein
MANKKNIENDIKNQMKELINSVEVENLINKNEIVFDYDTVTYRVKKPTFKQQQEAYQKRLEKYTSLLSNDAFMLEEALITMYKKKGINIDAISDKIRELIIDKNKMLLKLGDALKNNAPDNETEMFKKEIEELDGQIYSLNIQKTNLLGASIEHQSLIFYYTYLAYLITEKKNKKNKWEKVWNTFEEFENSDSALIDRICYYGSLMVGDNDLSS